MRTNNEIVVHLSKLMGDIRDFVEKKDFSGLDTFLLQFPGNGSDFQDLLAILSVTWYSRNSLKNRDRLITYAFVSGIAKYGIEKTWAMLEYRICYK